VEQGASAEGPSKFGGAPSKFGIASAASAPRLSERGACAGQAEAGPLKLRQAG